MTLPAQKYKLPTQAQRCSSVPDSLSHAHSPDASHADRSASWADPCRYVDAPSLSGFSPLHYAVASGSLATVREVLQYQPNIVSSNLWDAWEYGLDVPPHSTPLHIAAARGAGAIALALLRYYAERAEARLCPDPRLPRDGLGRAPWQIAHSAKNMYLSRLLNPLLTLDQVFSPEELSPVGVPTLAFLAAAAHKAGLLASIEQCTGRPVAGSQRFQASSAPSASGSSSGGHKGSARSSSGRPAESNSGNEDDSHMQLRRSPSACQLQQQGSCSSSNSIDDSVGDLDGEGVCDICFASKIQLRPAACHHGLCGGCAATLVQGMKKECTGCPFCRQNISKFVPVGATSL